MTAAPHSRRRRPRDRITQVPALVVGLAVLAGAAIVLPLLAVVVAVPWDQASGLLLAPSSLTALRLSVQTSAISAVICLLLALPLAVVLARARFWGRSLLRAVVLVPLVLPPVVSGLALLMTVGKKGLLGGVLADLDVQIVFTTTAVVLAQVFVSVPFAVLTIESALGALGTRAERAAATLGASPLRTLVLVTLPRLAPALVTATILAFARSMGEFGATLTVAGSLEGTTRTLPLLIYLARETDTGSAALLSVLLMVTAMGVVLLAYSRTPGRDRGEGS